MSPSDYENHPLRSLLARLSELANSPEFTDPDLLSNEVNASTLESIFAIVASVRLMLDKSPALLVSEYGLAQLQTIFQSIFNELSARRPPSFSSTRLWSPGVNLTAFE